MPFFFVFTVLFCFFKLRFLYGLTKDFAPINWIAIPLLPFILSIEILPNRIDTREDKALFVSLLKSANNPVSNSEMLWFCFVAFWYNKNIKYCPSYQNTIRVNFPFVLKKFINLWPHTIKAAVLHHSIS